MSVQLELYPQNYQGYSNPVSSSSSTSSTVIGGNMFSDGETFTTLNSSSTQENTTQVTTTPGIFNNEARTLSKVLGIDGEQHKSLFVTLATLTLHQLIHTQHKQEEI